MDAAKFPRVTEIIRAVGLGPDLSRARPEDVEAGQRRGRAVHALIEADVYGYSGNLDETDMVPEWAPYLDGYRKFVAEAQFKPIASEIEVVDTRWRYRGHPDLIGWLGPNRVVIEVKTGDATGGQFQVAAYSAAWNAEHPTEPVKAGALLHLKPDATYRFAEVELAPALQVFHAAVIVHRAQQGVP